MRFTVRKTNSGLDSFLLLSLSLPGYSAAVLDFNSPMDLFLPPVLCFLSWRWQPCTFLWIVTYLPNYMALHPSLFAYTVWVYWYCLGCNV